MWPQVSTDPPGTGLRPNHVGAASSSEQTLHSNPGPSPWRQTLTSGVPGQTGAFEGEAESTGARGSGPGSSRMRKGSLQVGPEGRGVQQRTEAGRTVALESWEVCGGWLEVGGAGKALQAHLPESLSHSP